MNVMNFGIVIGIVGFFFTMVIVIICLEAAFRNDSEKNFKAGIKKGEEESKINFPPPEIEEPKKD